MANDDRAWYQKNRYRLPLGAGVLGLGGLASYAGYKKYQGRRSPTKFGARQSLKRSPGRSPRRSPIQRFKQWWHSK